MTGFGDLARDTPLHEDAIFRIYSMTKPVTAVACLMLMEESRIGLDDDVARYIPGFARLGVYAGGTDGDFRTVPPRRAMTIRDLLRHTSGLTYGFMERTPVDAAYRKRQIAEPQQPGGLPAMLDALAGLPLEFSPGEHWNYSVSLDVLGAVIEAVAGQSLGAFFRDRIFQPLSMADTGFHVPVEKLHRLAACYYMKDGALALYDDGVASALFSRPPSLESGGGGLVSTAADYMRFARMLLAGGSLEGARLLSAESVALMTMNQLPGGKEMTDMMPHTALFNEAGYAGVAFGLGVAVTNNVAATGLPGTKGEYFWGGAAGTYFFNDPVQDMAVVFMTQVLGAADRIQLRRELRTLVYEALA